MSFLVVYGRDHWIQREHIVETNSPLSSHATLEEASKARSLCGDLIFDSETNQIVENDCWLWDWEKENQKSYAFLVIKSKAKVEFRW